MRAPRRQSRGGAGNDFFDASSALKAAVGYTALQSVDGVIQSGADILLEDPGQDNLAPDASGQWVYSGTEATFEQALLHEIGHAIGFSDNANATSILSYYLDADNRSLSAADLAAAGTLYDVSMGASSLANAIGASATLTAPHP
ncbi:MAG TPA: matrixin family metalloprotease [Methylocystis sp.]|nr:matrixin family metalloprotease [Methylocystis sp.]